MLGNPKLRLDGKGPPQDAPAEVAGKFFKTAMLKDEKSISARKEKRLTGVRCRSRDTPPFLPSVKAF
jgi:hypothetical protein